MAKPIGGKVVTKEYAKHLRKWGKRDANKRFRQKMKQETTVKCNILSKTVTK